jgi:hypothetical protein
MNSTFRSLEINIFEERLRDYFNMHDRCNFCTVQYLSASVARLGGGRRSSGVLRMSTRTLRPPVTPGNDDIPFDVVFDCVEWHDWAANRRELSSAGAVHAGGT